MIAALWIIKHKGGHNLTSKSYATLRQEYAAHLSWLKTGKKTGPFSEQARKNMSEARLRDGPWMKGKKHTEEAKVAMSAKRKGVYTGEKNSFFGKNHSEETKKLQSLKKKAQKKFPCAFCGGEYCASMLTRWHGDNCKHKGVI